MRQLHPAEAELKHLDDCITEAKIKAQKYSADSQPSFASKAFSGVTGIPIASGQSVDADIAAQKMYETDQAVCYEHGNIIPPKGPQGLIEKAATKLGNGQHGFKGK